MRLVTHVVKKANIIELNGQQYDAYSGALLGSDHSAPSSRSIDGLVGKQPQPKPASHRSAPSAPVATKLANSHRVMDISRPGDRQLKHHPAKKSQTLMRSGVTKPDKSLKRTVKAVSRTDALIGRPQVSVVKKLAYPEIDLRRERRAHGVVRSNLIHRFSLAPAAQPVARPAATHLKPVHAATPPIHAVAQPMPGASSMDVFERALERANSHMELPKAHSTKKAHKKRAGLGKRALSISASALAVLLVAGFLAYQNQANLTIRYASTKAGFAANLPSYRPSGFKPGTFTYSPGLVGINYRDAASGQSFSLLQKQSTWDSSSLLSNYVSVSSSSYKTIESAGRTIYTYGNNNATWVNGGVWYRVTTNGTLTTNELVSLATSM